MKNWMGLDCHFSDQYLNWRVTENEMINLRNLVDSIPKEYHQTVYRIMEIGREHSRYDEWDNEAGDSL